MFTKNVMTFKQYSEIADKEMCSKNVDNVNDLKNEHILIGKLCQNSTLNGVCGVKNSGKDRITETFKEFKKAGV